MHKRQRYITCVVYLMATRGTGFNPQLHKNALSSLQVHPVIHYLKNILRPKKKKKSKFPHSSKVHIKRISQINTFWVEELSKRKCDKHPRLVKWWDGVEILLVSWMLTWRWVRLRSLPLALLQVSKWNSSRAEIWALHCPSWSIQVADFGQKAPSTWLQLQRTTSEALWTGRIEEKDWSWA